MKHTLLILFFLCLTLKILGQPQTRNAAPADSGPFQVEWKRLFKGQSIRTVDLVTDTAGFTYLTALFEGTVRFGGHLLNGTGGKDVMVAKVSPRGDVIWARNYGGMLDDAPTALTLDGKGNVYIAGHFGASAVFQNALLSARDENELFVAKIQTTGELAWAKAARTRGNSRINDLAVHAQTGTCYAVGEFDQLLVFEGDTLKCLSGWDMFAVRFDSLGTATRLDQIITPKGYNRLNAAACDPLGNLYLTGHCVSGTVFGSNYVLAERAGYFLAKLNPQGDALWIAQGKESENSAGEQLALSRNGQIVLQGRFQQGIELGGQRLAARGAHNAFVARFDSKGEVKWNTIAHAPYQLSSPRIAVDDLDYLYLAAIYTQQAQVGDQVFRSKAAQELFVARIAPDGKSQVSRSFETTMTDSALSIALTQNRWLMLAAPGTIDGQQYERYSDDGYFEVQPIFLAKVTTGNDLPACMPPSELRVIELRERDALCIWEHDEEAKGYEVQYRDLRTDDWATRTVPRASILLSELEAGVEYEIKARKICPRGFSEYGKSLSFRTLMPLIICETPKEFAVRAVNPTHATVQWFHDDNSEDYTTYEVFYRQKGQREWYSHFTNASLQLLSDLTPGTGYEVRIMAHCENNFHSDTSEIRSFTTLKIVECKAPDQLKVDFISSNSAHVSWKPVDQSISYRVKWRQVGSSAWEVTNSSLNTLTIVNLEPDSWYELSVRSKCDAESYSAYTEPYKFRTLIVCDPPRNVSVSNLTSDGVRVRWQSPRSNQYHFQVRYQNLATGLWKSQNVVGQQVYLKDLAPETEYELHVHSLCNDTVRSTTSGVYTFSTLPNTPCNPPDRVTVVSSEYRATVTWNQPEGAISYVLMWKLDKPEEPWTKTQIKNPGRGEFEIENLLPEATYLLRLQTQCLASNAWVEKSFVTLQPNVSVLSLENAFDVKADPNKPQLTVSYRLPKAQKARLEFYNMLGSPIAGYDLNQANGTVKVDTERWSTGVVFCKLVIDEQNYSIKKLAISK